MYMSGLAAYYMKNGQPVASFTVGDVMTFNVPGYSQVWLDQTQNGASQFSGPFPLPMAPYTLQARDVGTFRASVFELTPQGTKGRPIGTDSAQVVAAIAAPVPISLPPVIQQVPAPGYTPGVIPGSGSGLLPSGIRTPSQPPIIVSVPGGGSYIAPPIGETGSPVAEEGMSPLTIALIAGIGLLLLTMKWK